jgi:hypothetical protein
MVEGSMRPLHRMLRAQLSALPLRCPFEDCGVVVSLAELASHMNQCNFCPNDVDSLQDVLEALSGNKYKSFEQVSRVMCAL